MLQEVGRGYRRLKVFTMGYKGFARDWYHDILYQNTPTSRICLPGVGQFEPNRCLDTIGIPRKSLPTLEDRCNVATKPELERVGDDINHPNQIFLTKSNTSHGFNLTSKPGSVAIPKSGTKRHENSCIARAARLLL